MCVTYELEGVCQVVVEGLGGPVGPLLQQAAQPPGVLLPAELRTVHLQMLCRYYRYYR